MSEQPSWETMNEKERVRWLLEHVMGWHTTEDWTDLKSFPAGMWDESDQIWYVEPDRGYPPKRFSPLHDMNDAWLLIKRLVELYGDDRPDFDSFWPKYEFMSRMGTYQPFEGKRDEVVVTVAHLAAWTPARIAEAVYHAIWMPVSRERK